MNPRNPLSLNELKAMLQNYCDAKGKTPVGKDQVKKDFFLTMLNAIETNTLSIEKLDSELINVQTKDLFYYRLSWLSPNKKCQAAQLVASLYETVGRPLTDEEFDFVISGNVKELKKIQHYNPFDNPFTEFIAPSESTNPFDALLNDAPTTPIQQPIKYNPFDDDVQQPSKYNPFDDDVFFASIAPQEAASHKNYNPFDTSNTLFTSHSHQNSPDQPPPLPAFHPVKVIRK